MRPTLHTSLLSLILAGFAQIGAVAAEPNQSDDVGDAIYNTPLDSSAASAKASVVSPGPTQATKPEASAANGDIQYGDPASEAPKKGANLANAAAVTAKPTLPDLPASAQEAVTQSGVYVFNFDATPVEAVMRQLGRHCDRPLQLSLKRSFKISGSWKEASIRPILEDIAKRYGLNFTDNKSSYTLDDNGSPVVLAAAEVRLPDAKEEAASALSDALTSPVIQVEPASTRGRARAEKSYKTDLQKILKKRAELEREGTP